MDPRSTCCSLKHIPSYTVTFDDEYSALLTLQTASVYWQTLDVFDFAKLSTLKCEPYQRLGTKNSFSFKLGIGFGTTLLGLTLLCIMPQSVIPCPVDTFGARILLCSYRIHVHLVRRIAGANTRLLLLFQPHLLAIKVKCMLLK